MRRKTIIAPSVIVRPSRAQRLLRLTLLLTAFLLAIGYSYDYGRRHAPTVASATNGADSTAAQRIQALERTRDALQARVDALEAAQRADRTLPDPAATPVPQPAPKPASTLAPDPTPAADLTTAPKTATAGTPSGITAAAAAPAGSAATPARRLQLADVRIEPTATTGQFRFRFSVRRSGPDTEPLAGNIWIAVEGLSHGTPTQLPLQKVSENRRPYLKMRVQVQQDVDEILALPADFMPRNILIEAKPFAQHYPEASGRFDWESGN